MVKKSDIFVKVLLNDNVKLKATQLGKNVKEILSHQLKKKYEGTCSHHGYILQDSISIQHYSAGKIIDISLNGDVLYNVVYQAHICNPCIGGVIKCKTVNKNKFGLLAISEILINTKNIQILEIIIPQTMSDTTNIKIDDIIYIEIVGKKFELNDKKISIIGKISSKKSENLKMENNQEFLKEDLYNTSDIEESDIEDEAELEADIEAEDEQEEDAEVVEQDNEIGIEDEDDIESDYCSDDDSACSKDDD
jgi:DNA-directed RNA polymerase subunit E'/Rpb7